MVFVLQNLIHKINNTDSDLLITFIDKSKAFENVDQNYPFNTRSLHVFDFPMHLFQKLASLYMNQQTTLRLEIVIVIF